MGEGAWLIVLIVAARLVELAIARRNTQRLFAEGAVEFGRAHYPLIVALHVAWLAGLWLLGREHDVGRGWLAVIVLLQVLRAWTMASLGRRWTTRILVPPGSSLLRRGPYRFMRHPSYAIVVLEIAVVPLALGLPLFALVFSIANAALLFWRIRVENAAHARAAAPSTAAAKILANKALRL